MRVDTENYSFDRGWVDDLVARTGRTPACLIPLLQAMQERFRYLPEPLLRYLCTITDVTPAAIAGVSTFYSKFRHRPAGQYAVKVCIGTACHIKGAEQIYDALLRHLGCQEGEDTDSQGVFTVEKVACLGCCTLAPAVQIDTITYGHLTPSTAPSILSDFLRRKSEAGSTNGEDRGDTDEAMGEIRISLGSCCVANGTEEVRKAVSESVKTLGLPVAIKSVGCLGVCHQAPLLEISLPNNSSSMYTRVTPHDARRIIHHHFKPRSRLGRLRVWLEGQAEELLTSESWRQFEIRHSSDSTDKPVERFLNKQKHIATEHYGNLDPTDIEEYRQSGGFSALKHCLQHGDPQHIIRTITESGLRGRGGGGFPTGLKWETVRSHIKDQAYVICNGDEGDPGAFMDRKLLESYPYRIIEGMIIGAFAVGASQGYLYIRSEYPLALKRAHLALERCKKEGLVGRNILGTGFSFELRIMEGAGAFVCGEETALIRSIEGERGMPRLRPPYPAACGLWNFPTLINNCETFACVPWIMRNGAQAFCAVGTQKSSGTKVFALAGKIRNGGLIEVPMGITVRDIVENIGGGVAAGRTFKAVQIGGPSGGCIPAALADTSVDFEALTHAGAMMGSGGIVVLDDRDCMVDIARYFLNFTQKESCGRCTFCRIGTRRMLDILEGLQQGRGKPGDLERLEELAHQVARASLCGLGKTAPNPVLTTLRYFRGEYEAHLRGECPAGACKALVAYVIDSSCNGCTICAQRCPTKAIPFSPYQQHRIDDGACVRCDTCRQVCPVKAIRIASRTKDPACHA